MKKYLKNFVLTEEFVESSVYECLSKQRWTRRDTAWLLAEYAQKWTLQYTTKVQDRYRLAKKIRDIAKKDKTKLFKLVDFMSKEFYKEIVENKIELVPIKYEKRIDTGNLKERDIGIASMKQQCFDYIAVNACKGMFLAKIGHYQCASLKNKGTIFGKSAIETWIRTNPKKCRYVWKGDIKKFYPSVDKEILKNLLKRDLKSKTILYLLFVLIDSYKEGLCIGSYLSQYLANYYLSYAYHYITEHLYTKRRNKRINLVNYTLFYMDDIIMFSSNKKYLKLASDKLETYLKDNLGLTLKQNYQLFVLDSRPIDMMGFRLYTFKTTIRRRIFRKANRLYKKVIKKDFKIKLHEAYRVISYNGFFRYSFSFKYIEKINLNSILDLSKKMVSIINKRLNFIYKLKGGNK